MILYFHIEHSTYAHLISSLNNTCIEDILELGILSYGETHDG
mgnify:CR=1 FL=1